MHIAYTFRDGQLKLQDVNATDNEGWSPPRRVADKNHRDMAAWLLAEKADPNAKNNNGWTPYHMTAAKGDRDVTELLRQHGGQD